MKNSKYMVSNLGISLSSCFISENKVHLFARTDIGILVWIGKDLKFSRFKIQKEEGLSFSSLPEITVSQMGKSLNLVDIWKKEEDGVDDASHYKLLSGSSENG